MMHLENGTTVPGHHIYGEAVYEWQALVLFRQYVASACMNNYHLRVNDPQSKLRLCHRRIRCLRPERFSSTRSSREIAIESSIEDSLPTTQRRAHSTTSKEMGQAQFKLIFQGYCVVTSVPRGRCIHGNKQSVAFSSAHCNMSVGPSPLTALGNFIPSPWISILLIVAAKDPMSPTPNDRTHLTSASSTSQQHTPLCERTTVVMSPKAWLERETSLLKVQDLARLLSTCVTLKPLYASARGTLSFPSCI
jgi:hypothetical protein